MTRMKWWPARAMKNQLRFGVAYWHTMRGTGGDPFGPGTMLRPWEGGEDSVDNAIHRVRVAFEFMEKLRRTILLFSRPRHCPRGQIAGREQQEPRLRGEDHQGREWPGPASSCFGARPICSATRAASRRATSPNADAFAFAAAQVKKALEVTKELGGEGYTFWGGREGYQTLWNTDMRRELDHLATIHAHGHRLCQADRLHRAVLLRAQAQGAHQAPI